MNYPTSPLPPGYTLPAELAAGYAPGYAPAAAPAPGYAPAAAPAQAEPLALTADEIAELRELRAERAARKAQAEADAAEAAARLDPPSAYVHLGDGSVIEGDHIGTHHTVGDGTGNPAADRVYRVLAVAPIGG